MRLRRCFGHHLVPSTRYHWSVTFDTYNGRVPQGTPLRGIIVPILSPILHCLNVLGGPYADYTGLLVIIEALHEEEVHELFGQDPFVVHEIICMSSVHEWLIFLDARHKQ